MRLTGRLIVCSLLAIFTAAIIVRDLWVIPNPTALPQHFAIFLALVLLTALFALADRYGRRWRHYETASALARGALWLGGGIGVWAMRGGRWYGASLVILGLWELIERARIMAKRPSGINP